MFSTRLRWSLTAGPLARALASRRAAQQPVLDLTLSNPTAAGFAYDGAAIARAFSEADLLRYAPHPRGDASARAAVAALYAAQGRSVDAADIHLTASSSEAYAWLFKLFCDAGDEILAPAPSYPLFDCLAGLESARLRHYRLRPTHAGWRVDAASLDLAVTARTRVLVAVNPNNPTGSYLAREDLDLLVAFCAANGLVLVCDEVFHEFPLTVSAEHHSALDVDARVPVFTLGGLSKSLGMPQMKLGWILSRGPAALLAEARERLDIIADTYLSVNTPVQRALPGLLAQRAQLQEQILARCRANLARVRDAAGGGGFTVLEPEGGWSVVLSFDDRATPAATGEHADIPPDEALALRMLGQRGVYAHPGSYYDFHSGVHLVLSLLTPEQDFASGILELRMLSQ